MHVLRDIPIYLHLDLKKKTKWLRRYSSKMNEPSAIFPAISGLSVVSGFEPASNPISNNRLIAVCQQTRKN